MSAGKLGSETIAACNFVAASLSHQRPDLFGGFVLRCQRIVQFGLDGLAAVVQRFDPGDDRCGVHSLLGELADRGLLVIADLL